MNVLQPKEWRRRVVAREHSEHHRQSSWLELLFDLSFVVAVAQGAAQFEHFLGEGRVREGLVSYLMVFAAIWWAWMSFTWFANVFDPDDVPHRLLMMVMIAGSLGLAAGVPRIAQLDFRIAVGSYVVMRLGYLLQWWRVLRAGDPAWRRVATRVIVLTTISQVGWVGYLWVPLEWRAAAYVGWFAVDLATPVLAGWDARAGGHRGHIVERYGLFTLIVLGESIAAATVAVGRALESELAVLPLLALAGGGLLIVFSVWWMYFDFSSGRATSYGRVSQLVWGYGHYFLFAAMAALGAGLSLAVDWVADPSHIALADWSVALVAGGATATILLVIGLIESTAEHNFDGKHALLKVAGAVFAVGAAFGAPVLTVPGSVLLTGLALAGMVAYGVVVQHRLFRSS